MNLLTIAGHLGTDAETRITPSGQKVTSFRVATHSRRGGKDETIWYRVTIWGDRFDKMMPYLKKGTSIIVIGELGKPEIYTDRDGNPQVSLDITAESLRFSPFGKGDRSAPEQTQAGQAPNMSSMGHHEGAYQEAAFAGAAPGGKAAKGAASIEDDDLPF